MHPTAPQPVSEELHEIELAGGLFPWAAEQPVFVSMPGTPDLFLPVFTSEDALRKMMAAANVPFERIKRIDDGGEFMDSLPLRLGDVRLRVIFSPAFTPQGRIRFKEIMRPALN